jgi:hypothetical protein
VDISDEQVLEAVRRHFRLAESEGLTLHTMQDGVRLDNSWWYVPVWSSGAVLRTHVYHAILADIEQEIEESEGLNVLLIPTEPPVEVAQTA